MASMVAENWEHMDGDGLENFELSPRNHNLLMSLLDETQIDECDDERLNNVIQSLEAEIGSADHYLLDNTVWESDSLDCQSSIDKSLDQNPSMTQNDFDLHWMDVEVVPTSASGDMDSWCMDHQGQGMMGGGVSEFGWVKNYSPIEVEQDYGSLWHETNATAIE